MPLERHFTRTAQGARKSCGPIAVMMVAAAVKEEEQAEDKDDAERGKVIPTQ